MLEVTTQETHVDEENLTVIDIITDFQRDDTASVSAAEVPSTKRWIKVVCAVLYLAARWPDGD